MIYICIVFVLANLPFLTQVPFVFLPVRQQEEPLKNKPLLYFFRAFLSYCLIFFLLYYALNLDLIYFKWACLLCLLLILSLPYIMVFRFVKKKNPLVQLIEVVLFYGISLTIGLYLESLKTNVADKDWRFYVVTLCVFFVFSSVGFIFKVLMKKRPVSKEKVSL